jgi:hypothetical protein
LFAPWHLGHNGAGTPVYNSYQSDFWGHPYLRRGRCLSIKLNL